MATFADRVKETSTTTGTGTYSLAGAVAGFRSFSSGVGNANLTYYCAMDGTDWEVGFGTYATSGSTLTRTTILVSSNANAAINWSAGTRTIFTDLPAAFIALIQKSNAPVNLGLAASVAANALTISVKTAAGNDPSPSDPVYIPVPNVSATVGIPNYVILTAALSAVVPDTGTLGASTAGPVSIWPQLVVNVAAGTVSLGVYNARGSLTGPYNAGGTFTALPEGIVSVTLLSAASTAAATLYSATSGNSVCTLLGRIEITLGASSHWSNSPARVSAYYAGMPVPGSVIQSRLTVQTTSTTSTSLIPADNTIPQVGEGGVFSSDVIPVRYGTSLISIFFEGIFTHTVLGQHALTLYRSTDSTDVRAVVAQSIVANAMITHRLQYWELALAAGNITYSINAGGSAAGTTRFGGFNGAAVYGGLAFSRQIIQEIMA